MRSNCMLWALALPISLACVGRGQQAAPANANPVQVEGIQWTRFEDPNEHAFSIDVPQGWKVNGGLMRRSAVDTSTFLRVLSPDGTVMLIMGDPDTPAFYHTPAFGSMMGAKPYSGGKDFARSYADSIFPGMCSNIAFDSAADRPDIATGPLSKPYPGARYDAGEVFYTCVHNGKPTRGYMVAGTYFYQSRMMGVSSFWGVNLLDGCVAPPDRLDWARKLLLHMLLSARNDPGWVSAQQARVDQAARNLNAITAAQAQASEANRANARAQMAAMTHQFDSFDQVLTQTGTFVDPSGQRYELQNTQPYHWVGPGGKTAETASPDPPPGGGWTQLKPVQPQ